jgi:peptidoglycan/LPS O-acetylase OafA/YrhL
VTRREVDQFVGMTSRSGIAHQPGLDGIRGLAVAAVVVFHTGLGLAPGGFLGVSLFFTLSGVVIGTVIIHELRATRRFSLRRFWSRRARRLLPAAWLVLAFIAVARLVTTWFSATTTGDVAASWLHVANWHFLAEDSSYRDLFTGPSALLHFWSLAIEEQFYLAVGLVAVAVGAVSRRPAHLLGAVAGVGALASFGLPILLGLSVDRIYYGTDTRAGELAVGVVIAAYLAAPHRRQRLVDRSRVVALVGLVALAATLAAWLLFEPGTSALRWGLLPATALASGALALAALVPRGVVWRLATLGPLRRLGDVSYGLYLVHWPVFIVLEPMIASIWLRALIGTAVSVLIALLSARLVELPVRRRTLAIAPTMAAATVVAVVIVTTLVLPARRTRADEFLESLTDAAPTAQQQLGTSGAPPADRSSDPRAGSDGDGGGRAATTTETTEARSRPPAGARSGVVRDDSAPRVPPPTARPTTSTTTTTVPDPPTVGLFGDSIALSLALALRHAPAQADFVLTPGVSDIGCGALLSPHPDPKIPCQDSAQRWQAAVAGSSIEIPVVLSCQWELVGQRLPGDDTMRAPGDPVFDDYLRAAMGRLVDGLRTAGAERVLWARCPRLSTQVGIQHLNALMLESRVPARMERWNALIDELAAARPDVEVLDLATWVDARVDDAVLRPDGEHYEFNADTGVAAEFTRLVSAAI